MIIRLEIDLRPWFSDALSRKQNLMLAKARPGADPVKAMAADIEYVQGGRSTLIRDCCAVKQNLTHILWAFWGANPVNFHYWVFHLVWVVGWVDFDFGSSMACKILHEQIGIWPNCQTTQPRWDILYWSGQELIPGGSATCSEGFVNCFLRVPRLLGWTAAAMMPKQARGTFRKHDAGVRSGFVHFKWRTPEQYKRTNTPNNMFNKGHILLIFWYFVDKHH